MQSYLSSLRNILTIIYALLYQVTPALGLPPSHYADSRQLPAARASQTAHLQSKRAGIPSSAAGLIGGGAFALILLALVIGLGSASVAILGSTEWRELLDRKKPKPVEGKESNQTEANQEGTIQQTTTNSTATTGVTRNTVDEEKGKEEPPLRKNRRTLKSFLPPMNF